MFTNYNPMGVKALFGTRGRMGILAVLGFVILTLTTSVGRAAAEDLKIPHLNGHQFTTNTLTDDPFIKTYIRNTLGIGKSLDLFVPLLEIDGDRVLGLKGDLLKAILEFEYQQAVKDWVAFRVQVRVTGRLGTGTQSLLATGVTANTGFEFGWMFKLSEGEKTALSGTLNLWNNSVTLVDFLGFVDGVVNPPTPPLVRTVPSTRGGGGLRYAWAASDLVGFLFKSETGMGESIDRSNSDEWFFNFAAAADFDLKTRTAVPLGLALGYKFDTFPEGGEELADAKHDLVFRIAYTGTTDFLLSLDFTYGWIKLKDEAEATKFTSTLLNLRYYF